MGWEEGHGTWNLNSMTEFSLHFVSADGAELLSTVQSAAREPQFKSQLLHLLCDMGQLT